MLSVAVWSGGLIGWAFSWRWFWLLLKILKKADLFHQMTYEWIAAILILVAFFLPIWLLGGYWEKRRIPIRRQGMYVVAYCVTVAAIFCFSQRPGVGSLWQDCLERDKCFQTRVPFDVVGNPESNLGNYGSRVTGHGSL